MVGSWQLSYSLGSLRRLCSIPCVVLNAVSFGHTCAILHHAPPLPFFCVDRAAVQDVEMLLGLKVQCPA